MPPVALKRSGARGLQLRPIALDVEDASGEGARWIQVAEAGTYRGHAEGEFTFDEKVFTELQANLRAHPSYVKGPDGFGAARVLPFDWRHASEHAPGEIEKQAAHGWCLDFDVRKGEDGAAELWSLTDLLEPARSLVRDGKIQWTSVAVWPDAKHPVTGERIGWYCSSIALTNDPFIQGMVPMRFEWRYDPYCAPRTPSEVTTALRAIFGLPDLAELGEVMAAITKFRALATGALEPPPGVDVAKMLGELRALFNLPTLSSPAEVLDEADKLLVALAEEAPAGPMQAGRSAAPTPDRNPPRSSAQENEDMALIALLAGRLNVENTEASVEKAVVIKLDAGEKAKKDLTALLTALGVEDVQAGVDKITASFASVKALEEAMPELAALYTAQTKSEDETAEKDVDEALQNHRIDASAKPALLFMRKGGVELPALNEQTKRSDVKAALAARTKARATFLEKYPPAPAPPPGYDHVSQLLFARGYGSPPPPAAPPALPSSAPRALGRDPFGRDSAAPRQPPPALDAQTIALAREIDAQPGRNLTEKSKNYLLGKNADAKAWAYDQLMANANDVAQTVAPILAGR